MFHRVRSCSLWNTVLRLGLSRCIASGSLARFRSPSNTRTLEKSHVAGSRGTRSCASCDVTALKKNWGPHKWQLWAQARVAARLSSGHKPEWSHARLVSPRFRSNDAGFPKVAWFLQWQIKEECLTTCEGHVWTFSFDSLTPVDSR